MTPGHLLFSHPFTIRLSAQDETGELVEEFARLLQLEPSAEKSHINVYVSSTGSDTSTTDLIADRCDTDPRWKSYNVRNRITIRESPDRTTCLCRIRGYHSLERTRERKWALISMLFNGILAIRSDSIFLIHGALLVNGEAGYVLTGPCGVGKSTAAARVPPPWRAVADDMVAVMRTPAGYVAYPLPTWSQLYTDPASFRPGDIHRCYPLSGIFFLEQSAIDEVDGIRPFDAIARLFRDSYSLYMAYMTCLPDDDRLRCKRDVLMHAKRVLDRTPCGILKVSMAGRFWEKVPT